MSEFKNPFKIGDKVKVIPESMEDLSEYFKEYNHHSFAVVSWVDDTLVGTNLDRHGSHYTHYELYKEEKDMTQQAQQKTKRVPFTHELWEKWKDNGGKVIRKLTGKQVLQFAYFPEADRRYRCVYLTLPGTSLWTGGIDEIELEIPITTKRIPFNPELKDAKVFHLAEDVENGGVEVKDWWITKDKQLVCQWSNGTVGYANPCFIEMEIEED